MLQKKIIKEYGGIGRIKSDLYNLPDVEIGFCQYSDGGIKSEIKNFNYVVELENLLEKFTPVTIEGNTSSGDSFVFHSYVTGLSVGTNQEPSAKLSGENFEVVRTGVVEANREYDFKIEFGLLQLALYQIQQIRCDSPFGEFIISPVQNSSEILEEIKASKIYDVTSHISFTFSSGKENLEKNISEIVDYLESVMILLSFAQGVFINYIYYNLYIKDTEGFKLHKSVHRSAKTKGSTSDELIGALHIQNFLESVLPLFTEKHFQKQTGVGDAIEWYLESIRPSIIESKFIHACIAIELLNYRFKENKSKNKGKILTNGQFKKLAKHVKSAISEYIEPLDIGYLFSWDNVPGDDSERLLRYLMNDRDIGWAESAEIHKSDDGRTIHIFEGENSAKLMIDENKDKTTLKIGDGRIYDLEVKKENGKLNICDMSKRNEIHRKIPELNRPTLKSSLRDMYHSYGIGYSDLFQEFEFVKIRDQIVHTGLSKDDSKDFFENYGKLVSLLQRTLLGMLNYTGEFIDQSDNWKHKKFKKEKGLKTKLQKYYEARMERDEELYEQQIKIVDAQIDRLAYDLYGLTEEEIKVVEE
jgi:hypothetical protein